MPQLDSTPIYRPVPTQAAYDAWLSRIDKIENLTINVDPVDTLDIGYMLFPLMNSISQSLFKKELRKYLKELGLPYPHLIQTIFRNGLLHSARTYRLEYSNGIISAAMSSSGGTSGFLPYDPGFVSEEFPETNVPSEVIFEYFNGDNGDKYAWLKLDRLAALVRYDLLQRKANDTSETIDFIAGWRINANRPR